MKIEELKNKKIAILGLGIEGIATAEYFLEHGISFDVLDKKAEEELEEVGEEWKRTLAILRKNSVKLLLGQQLDNETMGQYDVIIRSPGISLHKSYLMNLKSSVITSQTKLFFDNCPCKITGVTGTKGKGTTSSLLYEMLKKAGVDAYLGGNIGKPSISFLDTLTPQSLVVLELSSFQLEDLKKSPQVAIVLMITSDHLDPFGNRNFHKNLKDYVDAKRNIVRFQTVDDMAIINTDYQATKESAEKTSARLAWISRFKPVGTGCFVQDNKVIIRSDGQELEVIDVKDMLLPGAHNLENVCASTMAAYSLGVGIPDIAYVLKTFKGLEHRLELVREVNGVRYYDDSIATSPESGLAGVQAFTQPKILILGGTTEGSDYTAFAKFVGEDPSVKAIIGIGEKWPMIKSAVQKSEVGRQKKIEIIEGCRTMREVVKAAHDIAESGDVVLLSPACKSYDMFVSYKDRGNQFKKWVNLL